MESATTTRAEQAISSPNGGAPVPLKHKIYWRDTEPVDPGPPLQGQVTCDVCFVGGGYTAMWTANFLKQAEPSLEVHVVEAEYAGAGASGHNDGFATPTIGHNLSGLVRRFGRERAKDAYTAVGRSILELGRFCRKEGVDAELEQNGMYFVATNEGELHRLHRDVELASELGASLKVLDRDQIQERIGSPALLAGVNQGGAIINPHKLARGLARVVRDKGVVIHEQTRALHVGREGGRFVVETPEGRVLADKVVLATNAYQHQFREFRDQVKPVWSYAMVSEPVPDAWLDELPWSGREGFVQVCNFIGFARLTADNRVLIGGGPAPYHYGRDMSEQRIRDEDAKRALREMFAHYFPAWGSLRFEYAYGGCIAITRNLTPRVGRLDNGLYYAYGYCGNGISTTHTAGKALRDLLLERDTDYSNLCFVRAREPRFPPEPLAYAGSIAVSRVLAWQDRHPEVIRRDLV